MGSKSIAWKHILLYVLAVLLLSYLLRFVVQDYQIEVSFLQNNRYLLFGLSTLIPGIVGILLHNGLSNNITIFGNDVQKNILIVFLPIVAFTLVGLDNNFEVNNSLYGFFFAFINSIYAFSEEFGWRRYLQNALEGLNKNLKYILIGIVWWIWHFRFDTQFDFFIFPLICIGGGFLLGKLADDFKSILPVVAMHTLIILTTNSGNFGVKEIFGIGIVILGWIIIEQIWKRKNAANKSFDNSTL